MRRDKRSASVEEQRWRRMWVRDAGPGRDETDGEAPFGRVKWNI